MIIPVRCFTCGKVIADTYRHFQAQRKELLGSEKAAPVLENGDTKQETALGTVLDELMLTRPCCRRHLLTHVPLDSII